MRKRLPSIALALAMCLALTLGMVPGVSAADTVGMAVDPTPKEVEPNETFTVDIEVTISASEDVDTAGAHLNFDTTFLEVLSITPGALFTNVMGSAFNNSAGTIDYVAGAPFGSTATSDFVLATVEFQAKDVTGTTALTFVYTPILRQTCAYFQGTDILDPGAVVDGSVTICKATLEGHVDLQGRPDPPDPTWITDLTVTFIQDTTVVRTANVTTDNVGDFTVTDVDPGTYNICVKSPRALSQRVDDVVMVACQTTPVGFGTLREGDANNDDAVLAGDYSLLHAAFGSVPGDVNWNDNCDFNRNEAVEAGDYSLLHANFGQTGECQVA